MAQSLTPDKIGLRELSVALGVSTATVSNAINRPHMVKPQTRKRVLEAVARAGYVPNQVARSLKTQRTIQIGIVAPTLKNNLYTDIIHRAQAAAWEYGFDLILNSAEDWSIEQEIHACRRLMSLQVEGVIFVRRASLTHDEHLRAMLAKNIRIVLLAQSNAMIKGAIGLDVDQQTGARKAVEHLLSHGHRRFMLIGNRVSASDTASAPDTRELGIRQALHDAGLANSALECVACGDESMQAAYKAMSRRLGRGDMPTAIMGTNDSTAMAVMAALTDAGAHVPKDFSVVGFDNTEPSQFVRPALTTVSQSHLDVGARAVDVLIDAIKHPQLPPQTIRLAPKLLIRDTTGPCGSGWSASLKRKELQ